MRRTPFHQISKLFQISSPHSFDILGYQIDSRKISPGDLFFAISGEKSDGHNFLSQVKELGALAAVVSKEYVGEDYGLSLLRVDSVPEALRFLAFSLFRERPTRIVGVTGSVGKTTTKEFIATLLATKYRVGKTEESFNSKLTLPLMILNRTGEEEIFVLEMGASEPGDIARLCSIAPPEVAVITKIGLSHAANFPKGIEDVAQEKGAIFLKEETKCAIYDASFAPFAKDLLVPSKIEFSAGEIDPAFPFFLPHLWHNFRAAMHVATYFGMTHSEIQAAMTHLKLPKMRSEQFEKDGIFYLYDAYNANPESMQVALENLSRYQVSGKKIAALGSMKELGSFSIKEHTKIGILASEIVDHLLVIGVEAFPLYEAFCSRGGKNGEYFTTHEEMRKRFKEVLRPGDAALIKGSRSMQMEKLLL
jgi:UDP-N-acetylmuramoyl-tripeptide--D-alanyl-D-alanine ligase